MNGSIDGRGSEVQPGSMIARTIENERLGGDIKDLMFLQTVDFAFKDIEIYQP